MKSRVLMAALVIALLVSARAYAGDCGPCDPACDPCGACNGCAKSCDLFSGLKSLVACKPCAVTECGPCDGVVACSPCDVVECDPCAGCDTGCGHKFTFGKRLKRFFAVNSCDPCGPCNVDCDPCGGCDVGCCDPCGGCDVDCDPCGDICCDTGCGPKFTFKKFFKGFKFGKCSTGCCDPCGACDTGCGPCDGCCDTGCNPCDEIGCCDPCGGCDVGCCDADCNPCDACCGKKFGRLFDKPRYKVKKFFDGFFVGKCNPCNPCDAICNPCDVACDPCGHCTGGYVAPAASQLPEAAN